MSTGSADSGYTAESETAPAIQIDGKLGRVALTGASGYVGSLLIEPLAKLCAELRCITRNPDHFDDSGLPENAHAVQADVTDLDSLLSALSGCDVAYYLVHSLADTDDFMQAESDAASTFAKAAAEAGIKRIIYLGALAQTEPGETSPHIESRWRVGEILRSTGVPVTEFRAPVVIGVGSMPFEAVRALVERLPVMITPRWVRMPVQPIAAADITRYLVLAAQETREDSHVYEIGGADVTTYSGLMHAYARARGLKRLMVPVPVITPRLSSMWLKLVTPTHYGIGKRIVDSAAHGSTVADNSALEAFPVKPMGLEKAIKDALGAEKRNLKFIDALPRGSGNTQKGRVGTKIVERRSIVVNADEEQAHGTVQSVGGANGWFWGTWLWKLRGALDRIVGGPGMRSGLTEYPPELGGIVDFWVVERITHDRLTLRAEMKLPGDAWLDLAVRTVGDETRIEQTAAFDPKGLLGIAYWYALYPLHSLVFQGMLRGLKKASERGEPGLGFILFQRIGRATVSSYFALAVWNASSARLLANWWSTMGAG